MYMIDFYQTKIAKIEFTLIVYLFIFLMSA